MKAISGKFDAWAEALEAEFELYGSDRAAAMDVALGENRDLRKAYEEDLKAATTDAAEDLEESLAAVNDNTHGARVALLIAMLVLAVLTVLSALWLELRNRIRLSPLVARLRSLDENCVAELDRGLGAMSHGDLTVEVVPATTPLDEGRARSDRRGVHDHHALIGKIQASVASYNDMRGQLGTLIGEIADSSSTLSSASQQMASTSEEAGRAVGEIASAVGDVAQGPSARCGWSSPLAPPSRRPPRTPAAPRRRASTPPSTRPARSSRWPPPASRRSPASRSSSPASTAVQGGRLEWPWPKAPRIPAGPARVLPAPGIRSRATSMLADGVHRQTRPGLRRVMRGASGHDH